MERDLHANVKSTLLNNTPFVYAHLVKFERPHTSGNLSNTRASTNKENYTYLTDASVNISFNDGSKNDAGGDNGAATYHAQKVLKVGAYSETIAAKATNMNLVLDSTALDASVTATTFEFSGATIITTGDDFLSLGFREGDKITITGAAEAANNTSVSIKGFTNSNKTITVEASDDNAAFTSFTADDDGGNVTIKVVSPEIQGPLFNNPGDDSAPSYANRAVFIYKAFLDPDDYTIIGAPNLVFKGFINSTQIKENPDRNSQVTWQLTSHWGDFNLVAGRATNNASHRALNSEGFVEPAALLRPQYAYDLGFLHGDVSLSTMARYATIETRQKLYGRTRRSFWRKRKVYSLVSEDYTKAHEVDLSIDIQSDRLPVIYGVQFLENPIVVFADTNKVIAGGATTIYRIDALCEGEIQGIYDFHIEDQPRICINSGDQTDRGTGNSNELPGPVCYGNAVQGDTLSSVPWTIANADAIAAFVSTADYDDNASAFLGLGESQSSNKMAVATYDELAESILTSDTVEGRRTDGRGIIDGGIHRGGSPNSFNITLRTGTSYQRAHGRFVKLAGDQDFKRQTDYWESDKYSYWGPNHRLLDTAYVAIESTINADETEIPDIAYVVKGKKVECFNYDYSYEPTDDADTSVLSSFALGDTVSIVAIDASTGSGNIYVSSAIIIDKFSHFDGNTEIHRFRIGNSSGEPIDIKAAMISENASATQFRMKKDGAETYWPMQIYSHKIHDGKTVESALAVDATAIEGSGTAVIYTVASVPTWLTDDTEVLLHPKTTASSSTSTFTSEPTYVVTVNTTTNKVTLKNTANRAAFTAAHGAELPRIVASKRILLDDADLNAAAGTYNGKKLTLYRRTSSGVMTQERVITKYLGGQVGGSGRLADVSIPWDHGFSPKVYNFSSDPYKSTQDTYDIQNNLRDARVTINPSMQLLDYMTGVYGKNLDLEDDIDLATFQLAGRTCDTRSDITLTVNSEITVAAGAIYKREDTAGTLVWQGQVKTAGTYAVGSEIVFTNCIGKINRVWDNYTSYTAGTIVKYKGLVYTRDASGGTVTNPPTALTAVSTFDIEKVSGTGPNDITADSSTASKIKYSLYDADDVRYWRYFGWESRDQRWVTRHQVNTTVDTKIPVFQNVNSFLEQFNGILSYQSGKYSLSVATQTDTISSNISGGYEQNVRYITNEDIIGSVDVKDAGPKKSFNSVNATISDPAIKWGDRQVSFYDSNYLKADRGIKKGGNLVVSGISNYQNARISVENYLRKSRFGLSVTFTIGPKGLILLAGDTIKLTYDRFSWADKVFRITNLQFKEDCTVQVSAHEYDDSMYTITGPTAIDIENLDNKAGLNSTIGPPTSLTVSSVKNGLLLTWARASDASANTVTEIWMRVGNAARSGATLIHTTGGTETSYTHYETSNTGTHYFWVRHKKTLVGSPGVSTNATTTRYSTYFPTGDSDKSGVITLLAAGADGADGADGTDGAAAKIVVVTPSNPFFHRDFSAESVGSGSIGDGFATTTTPESITITAETSNTTTNGTWSTSAGLDKLTSIVSTHTGPSCVVTSANAVDGMTVTYTLHSNDGGSSDSTTLEILDSQDNLITPYLTNEAHVYPASKTGAVSDITGSGTDVKVFEGGDLLDYDGTGTATGKWKVVLDSPAGLTKGAVSSQGSDPARFARVADHTPATGTDLYSLTYTITGKSSQGKSFSFTKVQTLTKSKTGVDGTPGANAVTGFLTNENFTAPTASGGNPVLTGGTGNMKIFLGATDDTSNWAFTGTATSDGLTCTVTGGTGAYALSGTWTGTTASFNITATKNGYANVVKTFTVAKSADGTPGASAKGLSLILGANTIAFDNSTGTAALSPSGTTQDIAVSTNLQNISGTVTLSILTSAGGSQSDLVFTGGDTDGVITGGTGTIDASSWGTVTLGESVQVKASVTSGGVEYTDTESVHAVFSGVDGETGEGTETIYYVSKSAPSTPAASAANNLATGWTTTVPTASENVWMSIGSRAAGATNYTWGAPSLLQEVTANLLLAQKLLPWEVGTGNATVPAGTWSKNGDTAENTRSLLTDPFGGKSVIWRAINSGTDNGADGGFNGPTVDIDSGKEYRFSLFINQKNSTNGTTYWGLTTYEGNNNTAVEYNNGTGTTTTNPYFFSNDLPTLDKWYLFVAYLVPHDDTDETIHPDSGIWDPETGKKVTYATSFYDFKFQSAHTRTRMRAYQYYNTSSANDEVHFFAPRIDIADERMPSVNDLLRTGTQGLNANGFIADSIWTFPSDNQGWTPYAATLVHQGNKTTLLDGNANDPQMYINDLSITGSAHFIVRARIMRKEGSDWDGNLYYDTSSHGDDVNYRKAIADTTITNEWTVLEWDMSNLTAGGTDWTTNTITGLRFDFGNNAADSYLIDWFAVGNYEGASELSAQRTVEGTHTFDSSGNLITSINNNDVVSVTRSQNIQWVYDGTNQSPSSTTFDSIVEFSRGTTVISTMTIQFSYNGSLDGNKVTAAVEDESGEAMTETLGHEGGGNDDGFETVKIVHNASGTIAYVTGTATATISGGGGK